MKQPTLGVENRLLIVIMMRIELHVLVHNLGVSEAYARYRCASRGAVVYCKCRSEACAARGRCEGKGRDKTNMGFSLSGVLRWQHAPVKENITAVVTSGNPSESGPSRMNAVGGRLHATSKAKNKLNRHNPPRRRAHRTP